MLGRCTGAVLLGIEARLIEVEADLGPGLPRLAAVGTARRRSARGDRPRALGTGEQRAVELPEGRLTINLAPAEVHKQGTSLDLAMAVALLRSEGRLRSFDARRDAGRRVSCRSTAALRPVRGTLSMALAALRGRAARHAAAGGQRQPRRGWSEGLEVVPLRSLAEALACHEGRARGPAAKSTPERSWHGRSRPRTGIDLADVRGQSAARRALEIAAAGGHHLLLSGPPGNRQDDAGPSPARHPAPDGARRGAGSDPRLQRGGAYREAW